MVLEKRQLRECLEEHIASNARELKYAVYLPSFEFYLIAVVYLRTPEKI